jgi:hypothetical protein
MYVRLGIMAARGIACWSQREGGECDPCKQSPTADKDEHPQGEDL